MATISNANFTAIADNLAKTFIDLEAAFITNPGVNAPTTSTMSTGITSLQSKVAGLNDLSQESALAPAALTCASAANAYLTFSANTFYALYASFLNSLDQHVGGLATFLSSNSLMVHPEFAKAFNYFATSASSLGLRNGVIKQIPSSSIFINAEQVLASISVTGAAAGTFGAGTAVDTTKYSTSQPLFLKNTGASALTTGLALTITYTDQNGAAQSLPYTASALAAGATAALNVSGQAVTNIVVTAGGVAAEVVAVTAEPTRVVAY